MSRFASPDVVSNQRLASSVWLPWLVGLALLTLLGTTALLLGGRVESGTRVPAAVADAQRAVTKDAAQQVRKGVNEGVYDLQEFAAALAAGGGLDASTLKAALGQLASIHDRYLSLFVVDEQGAVVASVGGAPVPELLPKVIDATGMLDAVKSGDSEVILQYASLSGPAGEAWVLAATYDPDYLAFAVQGTSPASTWVVNQHGQVVGASSSFAPFETLGREELRAAAEKAGSGAGVTVESGTAEARQVLSWAPVNGLGPAGAQGWGVVTARSLDTVALPETQARRQAIAGGLGLLVLTAGIFGWLYAALLRPLKGLGQEVERLAYGDLRALVQVRREDEIGLMGRSLERIRLLLVRRRVHTKADAEDSEDE